MHEKPNPTVYVKKLNFSCGPPRCLRLVMWPTDKNVAHPCNKATLYTQYHAKTWKERPSDKILQSI